MSYLLSTFSSNSRYYQNDLDSKFPLASLNDIISHMILNIIRRQYCFQLCNP